MAPNPVNYPERNPIVHDVSERERRVALSRVYQHETSECKLQRARDVPPRIALFAPIALSNFVIGLDETSYFGRETRRTSRPRTFPAGSRYFAAGRAKIQSDELARPPLISRTIMSRSRDTVLDH